MTILSELVNSRFPSGAGGGAGVETNLEEGIIYAFSPSTHCTNTFQQEMCWLAPGSGTAVIELWGASGSGARMCCCGGGVPGNPGGYAKQTVQVEAGDYVSGIIGVSCGNDSLCWRGCSQSSCVRICHVGGCSCLCSEGGYGGFSICSEGGNGIACCIRSQIGLPGSDFSSGCGIVCNFPCMGRAYQGGVGTADALCCGGQSCTRFWTCCPCCRCKMTQIPAVAPGVFAKGTSWIGVQMEHDNAVSQGGMGSEMWNHAAGLNSLAKTGYMGWNGFPASCWAGSRSCGCYDSSTAGMHLLPYGVPGTTSFLCDSVRHPGWRGGMGNVRIRFIGS